MNKHDKLWAAQHRPNLGDQLRAGNDALKIAAIIGAIVIGYGIAGRMDYETAHAMAAETAQPKVAQNIGSDAHRDSLQGRTASPDGLAVALNDCRAFSTPGSRNVTPRAY